MNAVVTFDVTENSEEFIKRMKGIGYYNAWVSTINGTKERYNLPKSMLWKPDIALKNAKEEVNKIIVSMQAEAISIKLERCIVLSNSPWDGIHGELRT